MLETTREKIFAEEPVKMGVIGGTFDPIHFGHLAAAQAAYEQLGLDEVVFIPAGNPAFKQEQEITDGTVRFGMCCDATDDYPMFGVSAAEISREGVTYTVDTMRQLRRGMPACVSFVFILGADAAATLLRWRDHEELAALTSIAIVKRPSVELPDQLLDQLREAGFTVDVVDAETPDISSSEVRQKVAAGEDISQLVPACVAQLICEKRLYLPEASGIDNPLSDEFFEARKEELRTRVGKHRFEHSLGVAQTAQLLAQTYDVDVRKARLAGVLHDWDKSYDDEGIRRRADELGLQLDSFVYHCLPRVMHAHTAPAAIARDYPMVPEDVLQAMDRHTVAAQDMKPLDMVLYIADALEPNRSYDHILDLREGIGKVSLEELFFQVYEYWLVRMIEQGMLLHPNTVDVWNRYAARKIMRQKG